MTDDPRELGPTVSVLLWLSAFLLPLVALIVIAAADLPIWMPPTILILSLTGLAVVLGRRAREQRRLLPPGERPLPSTWFVPVQVICAAMMFVAFILVSFGGSWRWFNWFYLVSGLLILWGALYEARRARQRGRRW